MPFAGEISYLTTGYGGGTWLCWDKSCGQGPASNFVDAEFIWANRTIYHHLWLGCVRTRQDNSSHKKRLHASQKPVEPLSISL